MGGFTITRQINAPVETTFAIFSDFASVADHVSGIERIELMTEGDLGLGTRFRETRIMFKKEATEEFEVTAFEPGRGFTLSCEACGCRYETMHRFTPGDGGTRFELEMKYRAISLFARLMTPLGWLMNGIMKKCVNKDIDELSAVAESRSQLSETAEAAQPS